MWVYGGVFSCPCGLCSPISGVIIVTAPLTALVTTTARRRIPLNGQTASERKAIATISTRCDPFIMQIFRFLIH